MDKDLAKLSDEIATIMIEYRHNAATLEAMLNAIRLKLTLIEMQEIRNEKEIQQGGVS